MQFSSTGGPPELCISNKNATYFKVDRRSPGKARDNAAHAAGRRSLRRPAGQRDEPAAKAACGTVPQLTRRAVVHHGGPALGAVLSAGRRYPAARTTRAARHRARRPYSTVTLLARLRGWSTSQPRSSATSRASSCRGTVATIAENSSRVAGMRIT